MLQDDQVFQDLPDFDHMSELKGEDLKTFEAQQEQEQLATFTLQQLLVDDQPKHKADKGKSKVEEGIPDTKEIVITKPVDEIVGFSQVFSMTQWRT